jgi:anaerobic selenocysteine-containing dehydrogenase
MIAAELAERVGRDLGVASVEELWAEIEALAPSHAGCTLELLRSPDARDGVVVPLAGHPHAAADEVSSTEGGAPSGPEHDGESDSGVTEEAGQAAVAAEAADEPADQAAAEIEATEAQAAAAEVDAEGERAADAAKPEAGASSGAVPARPALLRHRPSATASAPAHDAYSLRLVATRKLYDLGTAVQHSPSLAGLVSENAVHLHPHDFARLGIDEGAAVTLTAAAGNLQLPAVPDPTVPKGSAAVLALQPGPVVGQLISAGDAVTDVRVERA